jgi:hypothetical protein
MSVPGLLIVHFVRSNDVEKVARKQPPKSMVLVKPKRWTFCGVAGESSQNPVSLSTSTPSHLSAPDLVSGALTRMELVFMVKDGRVP